MSFNAIGEGLYLNLIAVEIFPHIIRTEQNRSCTWYITMQIVSSLTKQLSQLSHNKLGKNLNTFVYKEIDFR
jgi:hypothetical protein